MTNVGIGKRGEQLALHFLTSKGIHILETNFRTKFGEIDIIARNNASILFVEVKTRVGTWKGMPYEAVDRRKISHMKRTAECYILQKKMGGCKLSLQVISIVLRPDLQIEKLQYFENIID